MLKTLAALFALSGMLLPESIDPRAFDFQGAWLGMSLDEFKTFANVVCYPATEPEGSIGAVFCARRGDLPDPQNSSPGIYRFYDGMLYSIESRTWDDGQSLNAAYDALTEKFSKPQKAKTGRFARWTRPDQTLELQTGCDPRPGYFCVVYTKLSIDARVRDALSAPPHHKPRY